MRTRAAVLSKANDPLVICDIELGEPQAGEVLVEMVASGVCHTDLNVLRGTVPLPLPAILGHEGAGIVRAVGPEVANVRAGDHVVLAAVPHCGKCRSCLQGKPSFCQKMPALAFGGAMPDGTKRLTRDGKRVSHFFCQSSFSMHAVVPASIAVAVDAALPLEKLGPLGCGIQTGAGAVLNTARVQPGESVVVFGCGGVGLSAIMAARLAKASPIIAVDVAEARLEMARELGATDAISAGETGVVDAIKRRTGGVDYAFECAGLAETVVQSVECARIGGTAVITGAVRSGTKVSLDGLNLMLKNIRANIQGSSVPDSFIPMLIDFWRRGEFPFDRFVGPVYGFSEINKAVADMACGAAIKPIIRY